MTAVTQIATVAKGVIDLIQIGQEIYQATANAMDAAEQEKESGADKKAWVLAYIKSIVLELGKNWDDWIDLISAFIDKIKAAYNAVRSLLD